VKLDDWRLAIGLVVFSEESAVRSHLPGLVVAVLGGWFAVSPASGQAGSGAPAVPPRDPLPPIRIVTAEDAEPAQPSPDATTPPPLDDFLVIPLRAHILSATDLPSVRCALTDADIRRVVGKVNAIWHKAGIHWALDPIVHEPAANQDRFQAERAAGTGDSLELCKILAPDASRSEDGVDVYYIHAFAANGVYLGDRIAFVQETAQLRPVPGGSDEPLPRVTAHELGHALGLPHRQARTNLLASGTTGTILNQAEVDRVRRRAGGMIGTTTVPDLSRRLDEAKARDDPSATARLRAILAAIATNEPPAPPR